MAEGRTCATTEQGERVARDHSAIFLETSSKNGQNVLEALVKLSRYDDFISIVLHGVGNNSLKHKFP